MKKNRRYFLILLAMLAGCGRVEARPHEKYPKFTGTATANSTPMPTAAPTITPMPTATPNPTATPRAAPRLILLQQRVLHNPDGTSSTDYPGYVKSRLSYIETLPFDGIAIHSPSGYSLMDGALHTATTIASEWLPLKGVTYTRVKSNFAIVNVNRPNDFFDDWCATVESFKNLALVLKESGISGILFDNEEYEKPLWRYPDTVKYTSKTLAEYYAQTELRGKQIMQAIQSVYPEIEFMVLMSPAHSFSGTPNIVDYWHQSNFLDGAFFTGLMEASSKPVIDGNEAAYIYRSEAEFQQSYDYRKQTIASDTANCPFISSSLRPPWSGKVSISNGLFNGPIWAKGGQLTMNPATLRTMLELGLRYSDAYTWQYWEGGNWYIPGGVSPDWFDAVNGAWLATRTGF